MSHQSAASSPPDVDSTMHDDDGSSISSDQAASAPAPSSSLHSQALQQTQPHTQSQSSTTTAPPAPHINANGKRTHSTSAATLEHNVLATASSGPASHALGTISDDIAMVGSGEGNGGGAADDDDDDDDDDNMFVGAGMEPTVAFTESKGVLAAMMGHGDAADEEGRQKQMEVAQEQAMREEEDGKAPGATWRTRRAREDMNRAMENVVGKERMILRRYGDVLLDAKKGTTTFR